MNSARSFLGQKAIRETLPLLADPGSLVSLADSFNDAEEMQVLAAMGVQPLLVQGGISMPAAALEAPVLKLLVQPEYRAGMEEQLRGSRRFEVVNEPALADFVVGNRGFIEANRPLAPRALFLQAEGKAAVLILTERFLLVIASQRDRLRAGSVLAVGLEAGSDAAVLFEYL